MRESQADVRIVGISSPTRNYPELIAQALRQQGLSCDTCSIPFFGTRSFTPSVLHSLKAELRKTPRGTVTVFCSGLAEYYLRGAHIGVHFSAYRGWFRPQQMRIIAHPWTNAEPASIDALTWTRKPPPSVGFMGTTYIGSRTARVVSKSPLKRWILSGHHLRIPGVLAVLNAARLPLRYAMTFPRSETLRAIETQGGRIGLDVRIVDSEGLPYSPEQIVQYEQQMHEVTYVLCPRGVENYSFRFYEALKFGRVPVLVDTDMVLPEGVNWDELIVRVPYAEISNIGHIISCDYERHSAVFFKRRQEKAFAAMAKLCAGGWANGLADDIRRQLGQREVRATLGEAIVTV